MADINPDDIPFVPPAEIVLTKPNDGKPTTAFHDWMTTLWSWMKRSVVDLTTKLTEVSSVADGAAASVIVEANTRATADEALAEQITTVEASVGSISANGQIYFAAKAAPGGAIAAYGIYLTAGNYYGGMEIIATTGGGSAIGFAANQFTFVDSGTAVPVFYYSGGKFGFTGDVEIDGSLTINGSITALGVADGFSNRGTTGDTVTLTNLPTSWTNLGAPMTLAVEPDSTGNVHPVIYVRDEANADNSLSLSPTGAFVEVRLLMDGVPVYSHTVINETVPAGVFKVDGLTDFMEQPVAGASHTFQLQYQSNYQPGITGTVFAKVMVVMIAR